MWLDETFRRDGKNEKSWPTWWFRELQFFDNLALLEQKGGKICWAGIKWRKRSEISTPANKTTKLNFFSTQFSWYAVIVNAIFIRKKYVVYSLRQFLFLFYFLSVIKCTCIKVWSGENYTFKTSWYSCVFVCVCLYVSELFFHTGFVFVVKMYFNDNLFIIFS